MSQYQTTSNTGWFTCGGIALIVVLAGFTLLVIMSQPGSRESAPRSTCKNNLKQIGFALHSYHETYGCFPPAYVADEKGRPMHSWRVLILPQLDHQALYNKYRFDEPWDGPNNAKLLSVALPIFRCPSDKSDPQSGQTNYVAVIGPETAWPGDQPTRLSDIKDGLSNTLLVVEVAKSGIHWMEPRDLHVLQMAPTINAEAGQGISGIHAQSAQGAMADAAVRLFDAKTPPTLLRALLTRDGGEQIEDF